jgi:hypothetical protein
MGFPAVLRPRQQAKLARGADDEEHAMSPKLNAAHTHLSRKPELVFRIRL